MTPQSLDPQRPPSDWQAHYWLRRLHEPASAAADLLAWRLGPGADAGAVLAAAMTLPAALPALARDFALHGATLCPVDRAPCAPLIRHAPDLAAARRLLLVLRAESGSDPFRAALILTPDDAIIALRIGRVAGDDALLAQIAARLSPAGPDTAPVPLPVSAEAPPVLSRPGLSWLVPARKDATATRPCDDTHTARTVLQAAGDDAALLARGVRALTAALAELGCTAASPVSALPAAMAAVDLSRAAACCAGGPAVVGLMAQDQGLRHAPAARRLYLPPQQDPAAPAILLGLSAQDRGVAAELFCAPQLPAGLAPLLADRLAAHWPEASDDTSADALALILAEFRSALAIPDLGPDDDFFDAGGHSLTATRIVGRLSSGHGLKLRFEDVFAHPTARALADTLRPGDAGGGTAPLVAPEAAIPTAPPETPAPLSLAQASLWKVYTAFDKGRIFNIPFALRFLDPVDERAFGAAFRDLLIRHPILRSHFADNAPQGPRQHPVAPEALDAYDWYRPSGDDDTVTLATEAGHVFDLERELPLRLRFLRDANGQVLSLLFHHIVLDEWSVDLLMTDLVQAYAARAVGKAPVWETTPAPFSDFARAQAATGPDGASLGFWTEMLSGAPPRRPLTPPEVPADAPPESPSESPPAQDRAGEAAGGWCEIMLPPSVSVGLHDAARAAGASLFNIAYAAIAAAVRAVSGQDDLVIGTSAAGRGDPAYFDTVGYFTTVVAHRLRLDPNDTPRALTARVREMINRSLGHDSIPIDLVEDALGHSGPGHMFELFIQIHAGNRLNGALAGPDGAMIRYRQIDPDKSESLLGLQFEVVEDIVEGARNLRVMMSYRQAQYGPAVVARLCAAVSAMMARFADPAAQALPIPHGESGERR